MPPRAALQPSQSPQHRPPKLPSAGTPPRRTPRHVRSGRNTAASTSSTPLPGPSDITSPRNIYYGRLGDSAYDGGGLSWNVLRTPSGNRSRLATAHNACAAPALTGRIGRTRPSPGHSTELVVADQLHLHLLLHGSAKFFPPIILAFLHFGLSVVDGATTPHVIH